jgi:hypothetical protein
LKELHNSSDEEEEKPISNLIGKLFTDKKNQKDSSSEEEEIDIKELKK